MEYSLLNFFCQINCIEKKFDKKNFNYVIALFVLIHSVSYFEHWIFCDKCYTERFMLYWAFESITKCMISSWVSQTSPGVCWNSFYCLYCFPLISPSPLIFKNFAPKIDFLTFCSNYLNDWRRYDSFVSLPMEAYSCLFLCHFMGISIGVCNIAWPHYPNLNLSFVNYIFCLSKYTWF